VGSLLFFECILTALRGRGKGVVLATHQLQYMQYADKIVALDKDGLQIFYGTYAELKNRKDVFSILTESIGHGDDDQAAPVTYVTDVIPEPVAPTTVRSIPGSQPSLAPLRDRLDSHSSDQSLPDHLPSNPYVSAPLPFSAANSRASSPCALYLDSPATVLSPELLQKHFSQSSMKDLADEEARARAPGSGVAITTKSPVITAKYDVLLSTRGKKKVSDVQKDKKENLIKVEESLEKTKMGGIEDTEEKSKEISQIIVSEDRIEGRLSGRIWRQYLKSGDNQWYKFSFLLLFVV
jgi:energy-coupling factor transporter ATP-binding protein EcfA2